jgi:RHS repeat-associated protein
LTIWREETGTGGLFLFHDHLGSVRITGDASGLLYDDNDYLSFGAEYGDTANGSAPTNNPYLFTGYELDSESSSDYATFRNLSTSMGRFNRPDPYDGSYDLSNPQSLNRYAYVQNRPLTYVDPSGLSGRGGREDGRDWYDSLGNCIDGYTEKIKVCEGMGGLPDLLYQFHC